MNDRANIPVSLPYPSPTESYWQTPPDTHLASFQSTPTLPTEADTVVIGSGITGACVAWNLLQQEGCGKVVMVEARGACSGASGRNGGHTKAASYHSFLSNVENLGVEEAVKIAKLEYANIKAVHAFARDHGIECDSWEGETVDVFYDRGQLERAREAVEMIRNVSSAKDHEQGQGEEWTRYKFWTADEVARDFYCASGPAGDVLGGLTYHAGSIHAYKFVTGVLKLCIALGMELHTHTPVTNLSKSDNGSSWTVHTSKGSITAQRIVLATNAYTAFLDPRFQSSIVPLRGQIVAMRPGDGMPEGGLTNTYSFVYREGYDYMVPRRASSTAGQAGDIIIGGGLTKAVKEGLYEYGVTDDGALDADIRDYLVTAAPNYFQSRWGASGDDELDTGNARSNGKMEWSGIMGYTPDGYPFVGEVVQGEGLWVCAGFQGHGMVLCFMCARALGVMMEEKKKEKEKNGEVDLDKWFPRAWRVERERLARRFEGRRNVS